MSILLWRGGKATASVDETRSIHVISGCKTTIPHPLAEGHCLY